MTDELSFQGLPNTDVENADILIQPLCYEETVSNRIGTASAPEAILNASMQLEYFEEDLAWSPMKYLWPAVLEPLVPGEQESTADYLHRINQSVAQLPSEALYIGLGGEHSVTPDQVKARMDQGTIVIIDAHADLRESYQGNPYSHACPAWRLHQAGYHLLLIGIRSLFEDEAHLIDDNPSISAWTDRDLRHPELWSRLLYTLDSLEGPIWLSIDMDGFDPALVPGVGTPQPGGLNWHQGLDIIEKLIGNTSTDLRGVDILELIPEQSQVSQTVAAKLIQKIISRWAHSRIKDFDHPRGAQMQVNYT